MDRVLGAWAWPSLLARGWWRGCVHALGYHPPLPTTCASVRPLPPHYRMTSVGGRAGIGGDGSQPGAGDSSMSIETNQKVTASHLKRSVFLYVRQSTPRQVIEHTESTARQYALRKRAVALGWHGDQVITIDSDLGQSAASSADREGFQRLVMEVSMGRAGIRPRARSLTPCAKLDGLASTP
jgi:hypothetical protein